MTIDLTGLVRPHLRRDDEARGQSERRRVPPPAARARLRPHPRQLAAPPAALVAARQRGLGLPPRRRRARAPDRAGRARGRAPDRPAPQGADAGARPRGGRGGAAHPKRRRRARSTRATSSRTARSPSSTPTTCSSRCRTTAKSRRALREQGPRLRRVGAAPVRPLAAGGPGADRRHLQPGRAAPTSRSPKPASASAPTTTASRSPSRPTAPSRPRTRSPTPPPSRRSTSGTSSSSARCRPCASRSPTAPRPAATSGASLGRLIDDFGLSVRSLNSLKNSNIRTLQRPGRLLRGRPAQGQERRREGPVRNRRAAAARRPDLRPRARRGRRRAAPQGRRRRPARLRPPATGRSPKCAIAPRDASSPAPPSHRRALLNNMATSLFKHERHR